MNNSGKSFPLFRPPAEADSLIIRVAYGCPHNSCAFCGMYKKVPYQERPVSEVCSEIEALPISVTRECRRVFLADGDVLSIEFDKIKVILETLNRKLPNLARVGIYANSRSIISKSENELSDLRSLKLSTAYLGLESGSAEILKTLNKDDTPEEAVSAAHKLADAGIKLSVMVLLGAGGVNKSEEHAIKSAEILNRMQPPLLSLLSMTPVPGTPLFNWVQSGTFSLLSRRQNLREIRMLVERIELKSNVFRCNHSSNAWPLEARLPKDKERLLADVDFLLGKLNGAYGDEVEVVPSWAL